MTLRISNLRLSVGRPESDLVDLLREQLGVDAAALQKWRILKKSLDARSRHEMEFAYSLALDLPEEAERFVITRKLPGVDRYAPDAFDDPSAGPLPLVERPVIVGSGPAGILAGYYLALKGYRPLILERGFAVKERVPAIRAFDAGGEFEPNNNYLFGEGGAGTFSDGKLTCRLSGADIDWVLDLYGQFGGQASVVYDNRPHLGSNKLPRVVRNFRRAIEALGGEYRFGCQLEKLDVADGRVCGLHTSSGYVPASRVILGIGHSARDTYQMLFELGVPFVQKAFQLGLRIEQPQEQVNRHKYGRPEYEQLLGAADYTLHAKATRDVYTFCMCAGGIVMPSISEVGGFCSNGMSNSRHDTAFANSGVMVTLETAEFGSTHPLAGIEVQRRFEGVAYEMSRGRYLAPIQRATDFISKRAPQPTEKLPSSYERGTIPGDLEKVLPAQCITAIRKALPLMDQRWRGDFLKNATLVGPEMRGSSPVRILRDRESYQAPGFDGLYPVGEGAGYAGGIISAAVDGLRAAREIVRKFALP